MQSGTVEDNSQFTRLTALVIRIGVESSGGTVKLTVTFVHNINCLSKPTIPGHDIVTGASKSVQRLQVVYIWANVMFKATADTQLATFRSS